MPNPPNSFKCLPNCGKCCFTARFDAKIFDSLLGKVQRDIIEFVPDGQFVWLITADEKCAFLTKNNLCGIYENRPNICIHFGHSEDYACPYLNPDGSPRSHRNTIQIIKKDDRGKEILRNRIKVLKERNQHERI